MKVFLVVSGRHGCCGLPSGFLPSSSFSSSSPSLTTPFPSLSVLSPLFTSLLPFLLSPNILFHAHHSLHLYILSLRHMRPSYISLYPPSPPPSHTHTLSLSLPPPPPPPPSQVRRYCLSQVDLTGHTLTDYKYKDIEYMAKVHVIQYMIDTQSTLV